MLLRTGFHIITNSGAAKHSTNTEINTGRYGPTISSSSDPSSFGFLPYHSTLKLENQKPEPQQ